MKIQLSFLGYHWPIFNQILNVSYKLMKIHQHFAGHITKTAAMPIYGRNTLKTFCPGTTGQILMTLCMKHQRPKPFIIKFCANYDPGLTLTYFMARSNFAACAFRWKNVTMMDSLEYFDLEFG